MGDAGEGLIDADARIQERMDELALTRAKLRGPVVRNPEQARQLESLKLARAEATRQLEATTHEACKSQLTQAITELTSASRRTGRLDKSARHLHASALAQARPLSWIRLRSSGQQRARTAARFVS